LHYFEHAFVDMDGVLSDLVRGVLESHDRLDLYPPEEYLTERLLGVSRDALWAPVVEAEDRFWRELPLYPWAHQLLEFVGKIAREVSILTKPLVLEGCGYDFEETGYCVQGKLQFLRRHFGDAHSVIFTDKKNVASKPGVLLVDDDPSYEAAFLAAGGHQFIWPQPYNRFAKFVGNEMHSIKHWYELLGAERVGS
jgi:hypothetical protein